MWELSVTSCRRCSLQRPALIVLTILFFACGSKAVKDAQTFLDVKEYGRAKELLELELKANPKHEEAYLLLGKTNLLLEDEDAAGKAFDTALLLDKTNKGRIGAAYAAAGQALYEGIPVGEEVQTERITKALAYLSRALTYDPDANTSIKEWALRITKEQARTSRTTHPLLLLGGIVTLDPTFRTDVAQLAMTTANAYSERAFTEEAAIWARSAGSWDPSHLKPAAKLLHAAGIASNDADSLRLAIKWDPTLDDEPVAWAFTQAGVLPRAEYLRRYPTGAHAAAARGIHAGNVANDEQLVAYLPFDRPRWSEDHTGSVTISSSNAIVTTGVHAEAVTLTDGWILFDAPAFSLLPGDFTISLFVKSTDHGQLIAKGTGTRHVFGIGHTDAHTPQGVAFSFNGGEVNVYSTTDVLDGTWHHLAAVKRGRIAELWVDGVRQRSQPVPDYPIDPGRFGIGRLGEIEDAFTGMFDELKLWRRALDPAEIQGEAAALRTLTNATLTVTPENAGAAETAADRRSLRDRLSLTITNIRYAHFEKLMGDVQSRILSESDLTSMGRLELSILRNSIYARHGRRFQSAQLQAFFASESWYRENPTYHDGLLTSTDRQNLATIGAAERQAR